jgi:hypothetical protein
VGAISDAIVAYAQPLLDRTDGSSDGASKALALAQICWNLALMPEDIRAESLGKLRPSLKMDDVEFEEFQRTLVDPMIQRHQEMFPRMHSRDSTEGVGAMQMSFRTPAGAKKYSGTARNTPCPCGSGKKYKRCCGG